MSTMEAGTRPTARTVPPPSPDAPEAEAPAAPRRRLSIGAWFGLTRGLLLLVALLGGLAGMLALNALSDARTRLLDQIGPARTASLTLEQSILNEETGVRGYVLTSDPRFLEPYTLGTRNQATTLVELRRHEGDLGITRLVERTEATAGRWRTRYAEPTIAAVREGRRPDSAAALLEGKRLFDTFRRANEALRVRMDALRLDGRQELSDQAALVRTIFILFVVLILLSVVGTAVVLRRSVTQPIGALAARVRRVSQGEHEARIAAEGAREVHALGADIEAMRVRIVSEIESLEVARVDLERSNKELEQFAYVASHDLQEPLRKVASFCQMLQRRYGGQLDERGEQYIEFAVDGAKRMQDLINDLLAFSRVGRISEEPALVSADLLLERTRDSLAASIEGRNGRVEADPLPTLIGEPSLLAMVFQNLIANGLKFQAEGVDPVVRVTVEPDGDYWRFTVADNGIGIDAEYADRIFVIFQRLHPRSAYDGTGIGLAMCRKVIEYHGGRIWLDTAVTEGATFHFTLPVAEEAPSQ